MRRAAQKFFATLQLAAHACSRIASELRDLDREQKGEQRSFDVLIYAQPLSLAERQAFQGAVMDEIGGVRVTDGEPLPIALPRETAAFYVRAVAPTADAAAALALTFVRGGLHGAGIVATGLRLEVGEASA